MLCGNDSLFIGENLVKQSTGVAMGNCLSGLLSNIYMDHIERKIMQKIGVSISYWKRYVDDIFFITQMQYCEILTEANTFSADIQFTLKEPVNNEMPFLDTLVTHTKDGFNTTLYIKSIHSRHILPWQSDVPSSRKLATIATEVKTC